MDGLHAINLSAAWYPPPEAGGAGVWVRRFGRPAGLESGEALWLVIESPVGGRAMLNGVALSGLEPGQSLRHEITGLLLPRNELQFAPTAAVAGEVGLNPAPARCPLPAAVGSVRLEIESRPAPPRSSLLDSPPG